MSSHPDKKKNQYDVAITDRDVYEARPQAPDRFFTSSRTARHAIRSAA